MVFMRFPGGISSPPLHIISASPEMHVRLEDGEAELRPIAGTRWRGLTVEEDTALAQELLEDEKERAEHVMLVDLGRNDLGRVCEYNSVRVDELMVVERYSHVMHIVSDIRGQLKPGYDAFDLLRATFPAGTVTGAPKVRAMEIIDELETLRRGIYAGILGYISYDGNMDTCITIRTAVMQGDKVHIQAGGGIVADSNPQSEYEESWSKARAMAEAVAVAAKPAPEPQKVEPAPTPMYVMPIKTAIGKVMNGESLTMAESEEVMSQIMNGEATPAQIGGYLMALRLKGETVDEITGSARAMRRAAVRVQTVTPPAELVDVVGTGGDGSGTFNISTTAAFVVAGTGQKVAKHGNRAASSKSGAADVLSALGVNLDITPDQVRQAIDEVGIGFMFAVKHHPAMKHAIGPRREMGVRTIFNILGPLTNPAGALSQVTGVYDGELTELIARVLGELGSQGAFVFHGHRGLDELTTTGPNKISRLKDGQVTTEILDPADLGFARANPDDLLGGIPEENAEITRNILSGRQNGACQDVVVLNAAAALVAAEKANDFPTGIQLAQESIDSGTALKVLENFVEFTQNAGG
jgi:anthranilate phosphoribosyltransferase